MFQFGTRRIGQGVLSAAPWLEAAWFLGVPVVLKETSPAPSGLHRAEIAGYRVAAGRVRWLRGAHTPDPLLPVLEKRLSGRVEGFEGAGQAMFAKRPQRRL